ncbi:MAG: MBL fold metallo-hydrolase [Spirochaetia bacterium]
MNTRNEDKPVQIGKNTYWVGSGKLNHGLGCNPYLLLDEDQAVLFDPGSVLDFDIVIEKVRSLVDLGKIRTVVLHHQDPDFCSALPLFEEQGLSADILTHWRSSLFIQFYGIASQFVPVNENSYQYTLKSGKVLRFIPTPYLHFPGSIMTYDPETEILFSSDLFGAYGEAPQLFADPGYMESMLAFHEHYMPSNELLRESMERIEGLPISLIAPQHGNLITENIPDYI